MSKSRLKIAFTVLSYLCAAFMFNACSVDSLTKDLNISLGSDFLVNPITIQVSDALNDNAIVENVTVSIEGRDKDKIYTLLGEKNITLIGNIFALSVKKVDLPTDATPLQFTVVIQSDNFVTKRIDYNLTSAEPRVDNVKLINMNTPPESFSVIQSNFSSSTGTGTSQSISFSSPLTNGKIENAVITINKGTKLMTSAGEEVSGDVQSVLLHSDTKRIDPETGIPNWSEPVPLKDAQGKDMGTTIINPADFFELKMTVGNKVIEKFSKPLDAISYIDGNSLNPITNKKVQEGDAVAVFSHSDGQLGWTYEGKTAATSAGNGKFKVVAQLNHLSTYAICFAHDNDDFGNYCSATIQVSSNLARQDGDDVCTTPSVKFAYKIVDGANMHKSYQSGYSDFANGAKIHRFSYPCGTDLFVTIYPFGLKGGNPIAYKIVNNSVSIPNATERLKSNAVVAKLKVAAICGTGSCTTPDGESCNLTSSVTYVPSAVLLFSEIKDPSKKPEDQDLDWEPLVSLKPDADGGKFATGCARGLERGKWYDFGIAVKNYNTGKKEILRYSTCFKFPAVDSTGTGSTTKKPYFYIPFTDKITIKVNSPKWDVSNCLVTATSVNNVYDLDFTKNLDGSPAGGFQLPCKVCCKVSKTFSSFITVK